MIESDIWPESTGHEQIRRRPALLALASLFEAHAAMYPDLVANLAEKWSETLCETP